MLQEKAESIIEGSYTWVEFPDGTTRRVNSKDAENPEALRDARRFMTAGIMSSGASEEDSEPFGFAGETYYPAIGTHWKTNQNGLRTLAVSNRLVAVGKTLAYKRYENDFLAVYLNCVWHDTLQSTFAIENIYVVQTATKVIQRCLLTTTDLCDLVLDPTCGSGTTAYVAEQWGRRWITIDTSRVALALARTRLMSAKYPYYILADSPEGIEKEMEISGLKNPPSPPFTKVGNQITPPSPLKLRGERGELRTEGDIKKGFVYKRVPHITLKSIANDPDIKEGMSREEIDAAIARHADIEILYDQPYEDKKRIRVSGPFTVESLSPHRILSTNEERPKSEKSTEKISWHGQSKRVGICIGPEHGTVSPELVKEAAKEAAKGVGFDLLIVCGFAFDPYANEIVKQFAPSNPPILPFAKGGKGGFEYHVVAESMRQYGKLTVLLAKINPDLAMGDELIKKTGAGNLFMIFGEPDIKIEKVTPPNLPLDKVRLGGVNDH